MAVYERSELSFQIPQGMLPRQPIFFVLFTELSYDPENCVSEFR